MENNSNVHKMQFCFISFQATHMDWTGQHRTFIVETFIKFQIILTHTVCVCVRVYARARRSFKIFSASLKKRAVAKHFSNGNTLPLLIKQEKLFQIFVLILGQVRPIQSWEVCDNRKYV